MADVIATKIQDIKKLDQDFVLKRQKQVLELIEEWLAFFLDVFEKGDVDGVNGKLGILPGRSIKTLRFDGLESRTVVTQNTERALSTTYAENQEDALFPTDIVSILSGLAELFYDKKMGVTRLAGFQREPNENTWWIQQWAKKQNLNSEVELLRHSRDIRSLITLLQSLLTEYKNNGMLPPEGFIDQENLEDLIIIDCTPLILNRFAGYLKIQSDAAATELVSQTLRTLLQKKGEARTELFSYFFSSKNLDELLSPQIKLAIRLPEDGDTFFVENFLESSWYEHKRTEAISGLVFKYGSRLEQLIEQPLVTPTSLDSPILEETGGDTDTDSNRSQLPNQNMPTDPLAIPQEQVTFSAEQQQRLQYEAAWISNRALYELFASQGVDFTQLSPEVAAQVRLETLSLLSTYSDRQLAQLFASPSARQKALFELYDRLNKPDFVGKINAYYEKIGSERRVLGLAIEKNQKAEDLLKHQLNQLLSNDNPTYDPKGALTQANMQNALERIDAFVQSYGLNELLPEEKQKTHRDVVWFIENLDREKLALILFPNLPPAQIRILITQYEKQLKQLLISYARFKAAENVLHTNDPETARGLLDGVSGLDQAALGASNQDFVRHFNFATHPIGTVQSSIHQNGSEATAGAFAFRKKNKSQEKLEQIYKTFKPEWDALGQDKQKLVYQMFGIPIPAGHRDVNESLDFITDFMRLTRSDYEKLKELTDDRRGNLSSYLGGAWDEKRRIAEKERVQEIAQKLREYDFQLTSLELLEAKEYFLLLRQEQQLGGYYATVYKNFTNPFTVQSAATKLGISSDNLSLQDLYHADMMAADNTSSKGKKVPILGGIRDNIKNKIGDTLRAAASDKLKQTMMDQGMGKLVGAATNPWLAAGLWAIQNREKLMQGGGILLGLGGLALYNMTRTVGGLLGGMSGGGLGFITGMNIGAGIGIFFGGPVGAIIGGAIGGVIGGVGGMLGGSIVGQQLLPSSLFGTTNSAVTLGSRIGVGTATPTITPTLPSASALGQAGGLGHATPLMGGSPAATLTPAQAGLGGATAATAAANAAATSAAPGVIAKVMAKGGIAKFFATMSVGIMAPGLLLIVTTGTTLYTLMVIQSAFLVNAPFDSELTAPAQQQFFNCTAASIPKPTSANIIWSADKKYAFPMDGSFSGGISGGGISAGANCTHWDGDIVIDIFSGQGAATDPPKHLPIIAYTSGIIYSIVPNDSLGGIYFMLKGDDGRWYYYPHNCTLFVQKGQRVAAGEIIAISNQTGLNAAVTPEHLHFGIQDGGSEPMFYDGGNVCPINDWAEKFPGSKVDYSEECSVACGVPF